MLLDRSGAIRNPQVLESGNADTTAKIMERFQMEISSGSARGTTGRSERHPGIRYRYALNGPPNTQVPPMSIIPSPNARTTLPFDLRG